MLTRSQSQSQSQSQNKIVKVRRVHKEVQVRTNRPRRVTRKEVSYNDVDEYLVEDNSDDECSEDDVGIYVVNIDFDEASAAWKKNKKSIGNGCYTYVKTSVTTRSKSQKK